MLHRDHHKLKDNESRLLCKVRKINGNIKGMGWDGVGLLHGTSGNATLIKVTSILILGMRKVVCDALCIL